MNQQLREEWKQAVEGCGGVEKFEKEVLPLCSESVRTCWGFVKKEVESSGSG